MSLVGLRELRQNASEHLRRVEGGETVRIARLGRPVALRVPIRAHGGLAGLEAESRLSASVGDVLALGKPLPRSAGSTRAGTVLAAARRRER